MPKLVAPVIAAGSLSADPQHVLTSETGLLLRPWVIVDAPMIVDAFQDPAIQRWHTRTVESVSEAEDLIDSYARGWRTESNAQWVAASPDGEILGRVALCVMDLETGEPEVGYWVRAAARGRSTANTAVRILSPRPNRPGSGTAHKR